MGSRCHNLKSSHPEILTSSHPDILKSSHILTSSLPDILKSPCSVDKIIDWRTQAYSFITAWPTCSCVWSATRRQPTCTDASFIVGQPTPGRSSSVRGVCCTYRTDGTRASLDFNAWQNWPRARVDISCSV